MLDLIKALVVLRLGFALVFVMTVLALLGVWTIAHGSVAAGALILAAVAVCAGAAGSLLARRTLGRR
jgi:hypothetical protein